MYICSMDRFVIRRSDKEDSGAARSHKKGYKQMSLHALKVVWLFKLMWTSSNRMRVVLSLLEFVYHINVLNCSWSFGCFIFWILLVYIQEFYYRWIFSCVIYSYFLILKNWHTYGSCYIWVGLWVQKFLEISGGIFPEIYSNLSGNFRKFVK